MPAKKHNFTVTEIKAGAMVLASLAVFGLFYAVVAGLRPPSAQKTFHAYFTDTGGLNRGADVRFGGAKVGRVTEIGLDAGDQSRVCVTATVDPAVPANTDSIAYIGQVSLTAEKHLEITTGTPDAALLEPGSVLPTGPPASLLGHLDLTHVAKKVTAVLDDVRAVLGVYSDGEGPPQQEGEQAQNLVTLKDLFDRLEGAVDTGQGLLQDARTVLSDTRPELESILARVEAVENAAKDLVTQISSLVAENKPGIRESLETLRHTMTQVGGLAERLDRIADVLQTTLDNAKSLSTEARSLLEASRPALEDTVEDLRESVRRLKDFSRTVAEQPQSLVRGRVPHGRQ